MASLTVWLSLILVVLGVGSYGYGLASGSGSITALIPAFFGALLFPLGFLATAKPQLRMHLLHGAVLVALLGIGGTAGGVVKLAKWMGGTTPARPAAVVVQSIMCGLLAVYFILAIRSFVIARRNRQAARTPSPG